MGTQRRADIGAVGYFVARLIVVLALAWAWAAGQLFMPIQAQVAFFWFGMCAIAAVGLVLAPLVARRTVTLSTAMLAALPFDLAGLAAWVVAFGSYLDPMYAIFVALCVVYALVLPRRHAVITTISCVLAYASALAAAGAVYPALRPPAEQLRGALFFLGVKVLVMLGAGLFAAAVIEAKRKRSYQAKVAEIDLAAANRNLALRVEQLQAVSRITEIVHKSLDVESVAEQLADVVAHMIGVSDCIVLILEKGSGARVFTARTAHAGDESIMSCVPVHEHHDLQVIFCAPGDEAALLESDDVLILEAIASQLVIAVENSQLYKLTRRLSVTDELTGLYNYRYLQQRLGEEVERARRYQHDVSLLMIDTDQFKQFNDRFGHPGGDTALAELGHVLQHAVREVDVVCRYGGEEFAVILPETGARGAYVAAENLRDAVREHRFCNDEDVAECRLTVSIGFSTYPQHAADCEELLREADDALYRAKHEGRDRVRAPLAKGSQSAVAVAGTEE
jgi:diguanylate cyclase (GGDEF)-like protein